MSSSLKFTAQTRSAMGRQVKALRREGFVPANIVSRGKESRAIQAPYNILEKVLSTVGYTQPVEIELESGSVTALVTSVETAPAKNTLEHVTFQEVKKGELITVEVPVNLIGNAPGTVKGMIVLQVLDSLEIESGALSIPEHIDVDISSLEEDGDGIRAGEITIPEGATLKSDPDSTVVRIETPRAAEEEPEDERTIDDIQVEKGGKSDDEDTDK